MHRKGLVLPLMVFSWLLAANALAFYPSGKISEDLLYEGFEIKSPGILQGFIINRSDRERSLDIFIHGMDVPENHILWETAIRIDLMKPFEKVPFTQYIGDVTEDPKGAPKLKFRVLEPQK